MLHLGKILWHMVHAILIYLGHKKSRSLSLCHQENLCIMQNIVGLPLNIFDTIYSERLVLVQSLQTVEVYSWFSTLFVLMRAFTSLGQFATQFLGPFSNCAACERVGRDFVVLFLICDTGHAIIGHSITLLAGSQCPTNLRINCRCMNDGRRKRRKLQNSGCSQIFHGPQDVGLLAHCPAISPHFFGVAIRIGGPTEGQFSDQDVAITVEVPSPTWQMLSPSTCHCHCQCHDEPITRSLPCRQRRS